MESLKSEIERIKLENTKLRSQANFLELRAADLEYDIENSLQVNSTSVPSYYL